MTRRAVGGLAAVLALWIAAACLDISSPVSTIVSITPVLPPTPSVVVNDVSRDTAGDTMALRVFAFGPNGDTVRDVTVRFFAVDSTKGLRIDSASGIAHGDSLSALARVVAQVTPKNGKGTIQTLALQYPVVPQPTTATKDSDSITFNFTPATDTLAATLLSPPLGVTVHAADGTAVQKYVVSYEIVDPLPSINGKPVLVIVNPSGHDSSSAVTDANGHASRQLRIRTSSADPSFVGSGKPDTARVRAHVMFHGTDLLVPSAGDFIVVVQAKFTP